jgi:hypothetical protein
MINLKLKKEYGDWVLYLNKQQTAFIHSVNDWKQIIGKWNWYTFTFIEISAENDIMCPGFEFVFVICGLGLRYRHNRDWSGTEIEKRLKMSKIK